MNRKRVFSGVQPSASQIHIGNYLGAMKRFVQLSKETETIVCIVDLHALTSVTTAKDLEINTKSLAAAYLAIGLDPSKVIIFKQSDVPEVCELTWYLACNFPLGLLERGHALKDAKAKNQSINAGVAFYPILMAADILLYKATDIPVGADQKQHIEMCREVAEKINYRCGNIFPLPNPLIEEKTGIIPGIDGRKMSKSYNNYIGLFEEPKKMRKQVMQIVTDSKSVEDEKDPEQCNVFNLYKFFATKDEQDLLAAKYRKGGMGYGEAKQALFEAIDREISPMRESYNSYMKDEDKLAKVLSDGAKRAREIARKTIYEVRENLGLK